MCGGVDDNECGVVRGTTFIITGGNNIYCPEGSQVVPSRPSGKGRLESR